MDALVIGMTGLDRIVIPSASPQWGGKVGARVIEAPGHFGLNAAGHLAAEGIRTTLATALGEDCLGDRLAAEARDAGIAVLPTRIPGPSTASSHVLLLGGDRTIFRTEGSAGEFWTADRMPWAALESGAWTWWSIGHLPADRDGSITRRIASIGASSGALLAWTPGGTQIRLGAGEFRETLRRLRLLALNHEEAVAFCGLDPAAPRRAVVESLARHCGEQTTVVVTCGGNAPALCLDGASFTLIAVPPLTVRPVDPTGAGDAFHAGTAAGILLGRPLPQALDLARGRAAATCLRYGGAGLRVPRGAGEPAADPDRRPIVARPLRRVPTGEPVPAGAAP